MRAQIGCVGSLGPSTESRLGCRRKPTGVEHCTGLRCSISFTQEKRMGLLDSVIGALGNSQGGGGGGGGGGQADLLNAVVGMLGQGGGTGGGAAGGMAGGMGGFGGLISLASKFQQNGLGDVMNSWIGTGENKPITPDALGAVLGNDTVAGMAKQLGVNNNDLLGQLSQLLPQVVDKLTPQGQIPQAGAAGGVGDLAGLLGGLLKR
jgi:uncharacterized protein YidB (DUF937 family)